MPSLQWLMPVSSAPPPFESFFAAHAVAVLGFLRGMVGPAEAEECAQEAFIAALGSYARFDGRNPRAWILTIARNKAIDHHRRTSRRPPLGPAGNHDLAATEPSEQFGDAFERVGVLPQKQRGAVVLRFVLDLPYREIGEVMGTSEAAARRSVHEGVGKLRKEMAGTSNG